MDCFLGIKRDLKRDHLVVEGCKRTIVNADGDAVWSNSSEFARHLAEIEISEYAAFSFYRLIGYAEADISRIVASRRGKPIVGFGETPPLRSCSEVVAHKLGGRMEYAVAVAHRWALRKKRYTYAAAKMIAVKIASNLYGGTGFGHDSNCASEVLKALCSSGFYGAPVRSGAIPLAVSYDKISDLYQSCRPKKKIPNHDVLYAWRDDNLMVKIGITNSASYPARIYNCAKNRGTSASIICAVKTKDPFTKEQYLLERLGSSPYDRGTGDGYTEFRELSYKQSEWLKAQILSAGTII